MILNSFTYCKAKCPSVTSIALRYATTWTGHHDDYQYLQRSVLPTMHFQRSLPRLPIPKLKNTCDRFLAAAQPIQTTNEFEQTQQIVKQFEQNVGGELHSLLQAHDAKNKHTSYISGPWFDMYLSDRLPLPLNYNPLLVMKPDARSNYQDQLVRSSNLIISSLQFWNALKTNQLVPEVYHMNPKKTNTKEFTQWLRYVPSPVATYFAYAFKAFPLDMSQYERLFGVSRIPEMGKDRLVFNPDAKHLLVLRRGNFYALNVLNDDGTLVTPQQIYARLKRLVHIDEQREPASVPFGVLTAMERNSWASARQYLVNISKHNQEALSKVDSALFCLCLDSKDDVQYDDIKPIKYLKHMLAGHGTNRWFDKSVSLIVSSDGNAGLNFEHSWGDGVAVLRYFNDIYKSSTEHPYIQGNNASAIDPDADAAIEQLTFDCDDKMRTIVNDALKQNQSIDNTLHMHMLRDANLSKNICKKSGLSPDALMQLSFQLAYRMAYNDYVGSYESCSTAAFRHGRTETIRPCTNLTKSFCENALQAAKAGSTNSSLREQLQQCSAYHGKLTKEAAMGQGFDRHLFALKHMTNMFDKPIPEIYASSAYAKLNHNIISTSTLSSEALMAGTFGPVVRDGLGIGYSIQNDECGAIVTSYSNGRNGEEFINCLAVAFERIRNILSSEK